MSVPRPKAHGAASYPTDARTRARPPGLVACSALCPLLPLLPRLDGAVLPFLLTGCVLLCPSSVVWPSVANSSSNPAADDIPTAGIVGNSSPATDDFPMAGMQGNLTLPPAWCNFAERGDTCLLFVGGGCLGV